MEVFYTVNRVEDAGPPPLDFLKITGTEQEFNETASINIEFNEIPITSLTAAGNFIKNVRESIEQTIANRQSIKQEKKLESLYSRVSDSINKNLPGAVDQSLVDTLKTRVY